MIDRAQVQQFFDNVVKEENLYMHSTRVANIAYEIGEHLHIDKNALYCYGLMHDIGKIKGAYGLKHVIEGYRLLKDLDIIDRADICLTHSFPSKKIESYMGKVDCTEEEYMFIKTYINNKEYDIYDEVIQVCDAIAGSSGCKILEISMIDVAFKYQVNEETIGLWKAYFDVFNEITEKIGVSVYSIISEQIKGYNFY